MNLPPLLRRLLVRTGLARLMPGVQRRLDGGADFLRYYSDRLLNSPLAQLEQIAGAQRREHPEVRQGGASDPAQQGERSDAGGAGREARARLRHVASSPGADAGGRCARRTIPCARLRPSGSMRALPAEAP